MNTTTTKGFTLIELLIVIGIIAILATAVLLVLNPAQILSETRDTQRLSDLDTVRSAINLVLAQSTAPTIVATQSCTANEAANALESPNVTPVACTAPAGAALRAIDGTGWIKTSLNQGGVSSPIAALPVDPTNAFCTDGNATANRMCAYTYMGNVLNKTFELDAVLESVKHYPKSANDGGDAATYYEIGTDPGLNLLL